MISFKSSLEDIRRNLTSCLVLHKGYPVRIEEIESKRSALVLNLSSQKVERVLLIEKDFEIPYSLGFVNTPVGAYYVERVPYRIVQDSVHSKNIFVSGCRIRNTRLAANCQNGVASLSSPYLVDTLSNKYPSIMECLAKLRTNDPETNIDSIAFDRHFAIDVKLNVYYKKNVVGILKDAEIHMMPQYESLKSLMGELNEKTLRTFG